MAKTFLQQLLSVFKRKTYTISPESFKAQFAAVDSGAMKVVEVNNPLNKWNAISYKANQLKHIKAVDADGIPVTLQNSPAMETRIILKNGKKHHFYFDTLLLENEILKGSKSKFIPTLSGNIPFESIEKIEIQNGGKNFNYQ
ncbi:MAG: hypothetical protein PSV16_01645 [Flavobacterium sp.]|nr:hypothetical protein [Flavobacterium sp.]